MSNVARNFVMLNNILTSLFHISPARDILHSHSSLCLCSSTPDKLSGDMTQLFGRHNSGFVRDDFKMTPRLASSHFWKAPFVLNYTCNSPLYSCVKSNVAWGIMRSSFVHGKVVCGRVPPIPPQKTVVNTCYNRNP